MRRHFLISIILVSGMLACRKEIPPPNSGSTASSSAIETPSSVSPSPVQLLSMSPDSGAMGTLVVVTGMPFDAQAGDDSIYFDGVPAVVQSASDNQAVVFVPTGATTGKLSLGKDGQKAASTKDFVILPGTWIEKAPFNNVPDPGPPQSRSLGIGFAIGNKGYMGMGRDPTGKDLGDINVYDPFTDEWLGKTLPDFAMESAICMVINSKAYIGMGVNRQLGVITPRFYEFDPRVDAWTRKADFPGPLRYGAMGLSIGNLGYVGFGYDGRNFMSDFWQYNPVLDRWTQKSNYPGSAVPITTVGFTLDNSTGYIATNLSNNPFLTTFWQYDPTTDIWTQKNNFPGHISSIPNDNNSVYPANALVINGNGYLMGGSDNWLYNPSADDWTRKAFLGYTIGGSTFVIGAHGYYVGGSDSLIHNHIPLWQFTP